MRQNTSARRTACAPELGARLPAVRAKLHAQWQFRREQLDQLTLDATEAIVTSDHERLRIIGVLESAAESALRDIEDAQQRLEQGRYGGCESCAEQIAWERLEALPISRLCSSCARMTGLRPAGHCMPGSVAQREPADSRGSGPVAADLLAASPLPCS